MNDATSRFPWITTALVCMLTIGVTAIGFYDLMHNGPFAWHVAQPQFIQGALELLGLAAGMVLAERLRDRRWGTAAMIVLFAIYARRHYIDYTIALTSLYLLGLYSLGVLTARVIGAGQTEDREYAVLRNFLLGVLAFTLVVWTCALLLRTNFQQTKILTAVMLALAIVMARPFRSLSINLRESSWGVLFPSVCRALLAATVLAMLAKGNYKLEYDSAWYGLRPDRILFGPSGLFQDLDLSTQVYYYPKLYEVLIAPLVRNGAGSGALGFAAFSWIFLLGCCHWAAKQFSIPSNWRWGLLVAIGTLPAVGGLGMSAKGELFAAGLVLLCLACLQRHFKHRDLPSLLDCASFALLASTVRLSMMPYLVLIFALFCIAALRWLPGQNLGASFRNHRSSWVVLLLTVIAVALVHYRTYVLTGYPLMGTAGMSAAFVRLGFEPTFPNITLIDTAALPLPGLLDLLGRYLMSPSRLDMSTWTGTLWATLPLLAFVAMAVRRNFRPAGVAAIPLLMGMMFFLILATFHFPVPGGAGYYFMVPIAALLLASLGMLAGVDQHRWRSLPWVILVVSLIQFTMFFMSANWYPGTRTWDTHFSINPLNDTRRTREVLGYSKLLPLSDAIAGCGQAERVIGLVPDPAAFLLPGRYESLRELAWANRQAVVSPLAFSDYLKRARIELVILPSQETIDAKPRTLDKVVYMGYPNLVRMGIQILAGSGQPLTVSRIGAYDLYHIKTGYGSGACAVQ